MGYPSQGLEFSLGTKKELHIFVALPLNTRYITQRVSTINVNDMNQLRPVVNFHNVNLALAYFLKTVITGLKTAFSSEFFLLRYLCLSGVLA